MKDLVVQAGSQELATGSMALPIEKSFIKNFQLDQTFDVKAKEIPRCKPTKVLEQLSYFSFQSNLIKATWFINCPWLVNRCVSLRKFILWLTFTWVLCSVWKLMIMKYKFVSNRLQSLTASSFCLQNCWTEDGSLTRNRFPSKAICNQVRLCHLCGVLMLKSRSNAFRSCF